MSHPRRPALLLLLALVLGNGSCGGGPGPGPELVSPPRPAHPEELFVITGTAPGRSFRIRFGGEAPPQVLAASEPTFYDGTSLIGFEHSIRERTSDLAGGGTLTQVRTRMRELDLLGSGHWVHVQGRFRPLDAAVGADCDPSQAACDWEDASGAELVSLVGTLRGIRTWTRGQMGDDRSFARASYQMHDRFGEEQDLLHLYGPAHRDLVAAARQAWDALPAEQRACHGFDYKSSILRPAPGGLVWVMHGTATSPACQGTTVAVEVPAPLPQYGGIDVASFGSPGEVFRFDDVDVTIEPGEQTTITLGDHRLTLPGQVAGDPPLVALYTTTADAVPEAHRAPLEAAFSEVHDLELHPAAPTVVDGRLDDWAGTPLLLLDRPSNLPWCAAGDGWSGAGDAALALAVRPTDTGWVVAARVFDDQFTTPADTPAAGEGDHLELWLRTGDGWVQRVIHPAAEAGAARVAFAHRVPFDARMFADGEATGPEVVQAASSPIFGGDGSYRGLDVEIAIPSSAVAPVDGRVGLRLLFADADDPDRPQVRCRVGTAPRQVDAWVGSP